MDVERLSGLVAYNAWANERTRKALGQVSPEQFTLEIGGSHGSLQKTVAHVMASEWVWTRRWRGTSPTAPPFPADTLTLENLAPLWQPIERELQAFVEGLPAGGLQEPVAYRNLQGQPYSEPLWQQLQHLVNHSSYHRGQVATLLRQLGAQPIGTDLITFYRERG